MDTFLVNLYLVAMHGVFTFEIILFNHILVLILLSNIARSSSSRTSLFDLIS